MSSAVPGWTVVPGVGAVPRSVKPTGCGVRAAWELGRLVCVRCGRNLATDGFVSGYFGPLRSRSGRNEFRTT